MTQKVTLQFINAVQFAMCIQKNQPIVKAIQTLLVLVQNSLEQTPYAEIA